MIESFEVSNFKCFETLRLGGLKRINLITGENASGKTALLEAIFAAARGNPEGILLLNQLRGLTVGGGFPGLPPIVTAAQFPGLWNHWFYSAATKERGGSKTATKISFQFTDSDAKEFSCEFSYDPNAARSTPQNPAAIRSTSMSFVTSTKVTEPGKQPVANNTAMTIGPQGQLQSTRQLPNLGPSTFIFPAIFNYAELDNVTWFSQARETGDTEEIVEFFKKYFPFIANLEVLQPTVGAPAGIYATLSSGGVRRLQLLSSGIYKIMSILLGCAQSRKGVVVIDEIENGIFYDKYALTWYILNKFSKQYGCQLFVTSHSLECMQKLAPIIGDDVDDFSLLHAQRENGKCVVRQVSGIAMKAALSGGNDVRGGNGQWASPR